MEPEHAIVVPRVLPLAERRAVGGPVALGLLATYVACAIAGWLAAAGALVAAAPDLAAGTAGSAAPVLAAHLVGLGLLAFGVAGASFHLLPVMLRNDLRSQRRLRAAVPLLAAGFALAPGIACDLPWLVWPAAALVTLGFALVLVELGGLVARAPGGRTLVVSRIGVALVLLHAVAALVLGAVAFDHGDEPLGGVSHDRLVLVHLQLAVLGWITLLIVTVARTLAPMLALSPAAPARRVPLAELGLTVGLWTLLGGVLAASRPAELAGGALLAATLAGFFAVLGRSVLRRRGPLEAPLAHMGLGVVFLAQAAVLGLGVAAGGFSPDRAIPAYVCFLLLGWGAGVVIGHLGKLLSLSLWVWWPPGPRPKQADLYPRRLLLAEAAVFGAGVEALALGVLTGGSQAARTGAALLVGSAVIAGLGAGLVWRRRPGCRGRQLPGPVSRKAAHSTR